MHHLLKTIAGSAVALCISQPLLANQSDTHPLLGEWVSNKNASIQELVKSGLPSKEIKKLSFLFGHMVVDIKEDTYTTMLNGQVNEMPFTIISTTDDCYKVKIDQSTNELCIKNNMLYVPSYKGSKEVFTKKI